MLRKCSILLARTKPRIMPSQYGSLTEATQTSPPSSARKETKGGEFMKKLDSIKESISVYEKKFTEKNAREELFKDSAEPKQVSKPSIPKPDMNEFYDVGSEEKDLNWFENTVLNTDVKPRWLKAAEISLKRKQGEQQSTEDTTGPVQLHEIVQVLERESGMNITVIDVKEKCDHMDALIITEGRSARHVYSLADAVKRLAKHRYIVDNGLPENLAIQGKETEWMVVDLGQFMVHCFTPQCRKEMDLEGVWLHDAYEKGIIETELLEPLEPLTMNEKVSL